MRQKYQNEKIAGDGTLFLGKHKELKISQRKDFPFLGKYSYREFKMS